MENGTLNVEYRNTRITFNELQDITLAFTVAQESIQQCVYSKNGKRCKKTRKTDKYCIDHTTSKITITGVSVEPIITHQIIKNNKIHDVDSNGYLFYKQVCVGKQCD